ncbi:hypothetical protein KFV05_01830 [Macrococcoides canis]|uniref:hypothetical protein n=1 Tax=Macrococcoides canis TaxID=1855823 RepID=UPI0020B85BA6|nr:hypothetical protein [Macrococcus canis]UTH02761.1 hypothetical protein KFV05_01830 [Macrococcus canis]
MEDKQNIDLNNQDKLKSNPEIIQVIDSNSVSDSSDNKVGCIVLGCIGAAFLGLIILVVVLMIVFNARNEKWDFDNENIPKKNGKHDITIKENKMIDNDDTKEAVEDIVAGMRENNPELLTSHITFNNKNITKEMAQAWLDLLEYTGEREVIADNFELFMLQNISEEMPVFGGNFKYRDNDLLKINKDKDKFNISLPQNRLYLRNIENYKLNFNVNNKDYNLKIYDSKSEVISDIPIGVYKVKAEKIVDGKTYNGEIEINPMKNRNEIIEKFEIMKLSVYLLNEYEVDEIWLYVDDKKVKVEDNFDVDKQTFEVKDESVVYATGMKNGKKVETNKVKISKSLAQHNEYLYLTLTFEE